MIRSVENVVADLLFGLRIMRRGSGFAALAVGTLALGIAAVSTIFTFVKAVYLRPLPLKDSARLVAISEQRVDQDGARDVSNMTAHFLAAHSRSFERLSFYKEKSAIIADGSDPAIHRVLEVDTSFAAMFDVRPQLGRAMSPEEILVRVRIALISDVLWQSRFGRDSAVIGRTLVLDTLPYRVVGVLQRGFRFPYQTDVFTPLQPEAATQNANLAIAARLRTNVSRGAARSEMETLLSRLKEANPRAYRDKRLILYDEVLDRRTRRLMPLPGLFMGAALFVLLIACVNVSNLFLARAVERTREIAIRWSVGASPRRLMTQLMVEHVTLGLIAGAIGFLGAVALTRTALRVIPTGGLPFWLVIEPDIRVVALSIGTAVLATVFLGLLPARVIARRDLASVLASHAYVASSNAQALRISRRALIAQLSLTVALFLGSGLLARSYLRLARLDLGYPADSIGIVQPLFNSSRYPTAELRRRVIEQAATEALGLPGIRHVAYRELGASFEPRAHGVAASSATPVSLQSQDRRLLADGDSSVAVAEKDYRLLTVSREYFDLLGLRFTEGRGFGQQDAEVTHPVAVVSTELARRLWPNGSATGRVVQVGKDGTPLRVIGVVEAIKELRMNRTSRNADLSPDVYVSSQQFVGWNPRLLFSTSDDIGRSRNGIVRALRSSDRSLPVMRETTMASAVENALFETRIFGGVIVIFGVSALSLALVGVFGLTAYSVSRRQREIGIRVALGSSSGQVVHLFMWESFQLAIVGLVLGILIALLASRVFESFLFQMEVTDLATFVLVAASFGVVFLAATWASARRASRVDPLVALRSE